MKIRLLLLTIIPAFLLGCKGNSGVEPQHTTISSGITGAITFTGEWPAKAAEVRMVTSKKFPPEMDDIIFGPSIPVDIAKYDYEFELEPGTYKLVGVAWRNEGAQWNFPSLCSFFFSKKNSLDKYFFCF